jgi:hypothetical protein
LANLQGLQWLLEAAGKTAAAAAAALLGALQQISRTPNVPLECVKALVAAGIAPTYPQLVAAARSGTQGLWVWVDAAQDLNTHVASFPTFLSSHQWPAAAQPLLDIAMLLRRQQRRYDHSSLQQQRQLLLEQLTPVVLDDLLHVMLTAAADDSEDSPAGGSSPLRELTRGLSADILWL